MANAAAGWYDQGDGTQRYWDGNAWTDHRAPSARPAAAVPPAPGQQAAIPPAAVPSGYATPPAVPAPTAYAAMPAVAPYVKPRKRVWPWVLGIVGGVLLLIIGLVTWGIVAFVGAVTGPVDTVNEFEDAVESGDCAAMEAASTPAFLAESGWEDCEVFKADAATMVPSRFNANNSSITNNVATVTADFWYPGESTKYVVTYTLIKQDGDWRVDGFDMDYGN